MPTQENAKSSENYLIPLEQALSFLVSPEHGCLSLWNRPELLAFLSNHPARGKLFHLEETSAAKGPWVLYYPLTAWYEEQKHQLEIDSIIAKQYEAVEQARVQQRERVIWQINAAKKCGDIDGIIKWRKELKKYDNP